MVSGRMGRGCIGGVCTVGREIERGRGRERMDGWMEDVCFDDC